jgi:hypothetical protein
MPQTTPKPRILVIEDDEFLNRMYVTKLEHAPAYRDAMLLLRHRLGGPSSLN